MPPRQLPLLRRDRLEHGGDLLRGLRKEARPFSPKCSIHVVMRSNRARGRWSMLHRRNRANIEKLLFKWAAEKNVKVYRFANVGNHLHLLVKADSRQALQQFLKTFAGLAARVITGARKGLRQGPFWEKTAYSRLVARGGFRTLCAYLGKNRLEAIGFGGARLRLRANGEAVVVVGDPAASGADPGEVEALIRGELGLRLQPR